MSERFVREIKPQEWERMRRDAERRNTDQAMETPQPANAASEPQPESEPQHVPEPEPQPVADQSGTAIQVPDLDSYLSPYGLDTRTVMIGGGLVAVALWIISEIRKVEGIAGPAGEKGDKGDAGSAGEKGEKGAKGNKGDKGDSAGGDTE